MLRAEGTTWQLLQEGDRMYLELHSPYGTVELTPKGAVILRVLESIQREYDRLKAMGPIEKEEQHT